MAVLDNPKWERFVNEYLKNFNATDAYNSAGYKAKSSEIAAAAASRLLTDVKVQARIAELQAENRKKAEMTEAEWEAEVRAIARANVKDVLRATEDGVSMLPTDDMTREQAAVIQSIEHNVTATAMSLKYKLKDSLKAYELLGRRMGLINKDKVDVNITMSEDTRLAMEAWEKRKKGKK